MLNKVHLAVCLLHLKSHVVEGRLMTSTIIGLRINTVHILKPAAHPDSTLELAQRSPAHTRD
jgi:hypothetical protein